MPFPMMSGDEVRTVCSLLEANAIRRVLEIGAGGSTLYFPRKVRSITEWIAVEDDVAWARRLRPRLPPQVHLLEASDPNGVLTRIDELEFQPELALIDSGKARQAYLRHFSRSRVPLILLHDAARESYQHELSAYAVVCHLTSATHRSAEGRALAGGLAILIPHRVHSAASDSARFNLS